ncbi:hypothetical protein MNBD_GAMMA24-645 [hydrothermal vent metagenome]|uniref:DUF2934 domain-containing protein n=1 Tax=hydrothermal vent metagenome TaxID=652676 RepID=A0A3B1BN74_9ZZZZ
MVTKKKGTRVKSSSAKKTAKKKIAAKKSVSRKKTVEKSVGKGNATRRPGKNKAAILAAAARTRQQRIAEAAYFLSCQRGYDAGSALEDWLTAEAQVDQELTREKD